MQLVLGIVAMAMIANLQYGWTLFVNPISEKYGWSRAAIQVAFTIFVLTETWLVPIEGWFVDKFGPRPVVLVGGLLCGLGWVLNSYASTLTMLYIAAAISGVGAAHERLLPRASGHRYQLRALSPDWRRVSVAPPPFGLSVGP